MSMARRKKKLLPPYVLEKNGYWYVRRAFPTSERNDRGKIVYVQIVRACEPKTYERAAEIVEQIETELSDQRPADPESLAGFVSAFLAAKRSSISDATYTLYEWLAGRFILHSPFGKEPVTEIKPIAIQRYYASQEAKGVSGAMIRKLNTFLSMCFNQGIRWGTVTVNPCRGLVLPRVEPPDLDIIDDKDAPAFAKICFEQFPVLAFALETGMRPGEYLALRWSDIRGRDVKVTRSVAFPKAGKFQFKEPKTRGSRRTVHISENLAALLRTVKQDREKTIRSLTRTIEEPLVLRQKESRGPNYQRRLTKRRTAKQTLKTLLEFDLVFPSESGTPRSPHNVNTRDMKEACRLAGLPSHSLYSLRHTCATLLIAAGANIKAVSERLGHSSIQITLDTYSHVLPSMREELSDRITAALY